MKIIVDNASGLCYIISVSKIHGNRKKEQKMSTLTKTIEWTTKTGKPVVVTMTIETSREINADGDKMTVSCCDMHTTATVDGQTVGYSINTINASHPAHKLGAVAMCGNLCITQANYDAIKAAQTELESTPEWQAKVARQAASDKAAKEYDAHRAMMRKVMGY